jgi:putative MATE family efflux protein
MRKTLRFSPENGTAPFFMTFGRDAVFIREYISLSAPIALQSLITAMVGSLDTMMVGQLGDLPVSAVGLVNQIAYVLNLMIYGVTSGASVFVAQYYGKGDMRMAKASCALAYVAVIAGSCVFSLAGLLFPETLLRIFSGEDIVLETAGGYFRIMSLGYLANGVSLVGGMVFRNAGRVRLSLVITAVIIGVKLLLSRLLIYGGWLGVAPMGVNGAAVSTLTARILEMILTLGLLRLTCPGLMPEIKDLGAIRFSFVKRFFRVSFPVIASETLWSVGITMYSVVFFHMGYAVGAAVNIAKVGEQLLTSFFKGGSQASSIMLGRMLGHGTETNAPYYAKRMTAYNMLTGIGMGLILLTGANLFLDIYNITPGARADAIAVMRCMALVMPVRGMNWVRIGAVLRAGGDTRASMLIDNITVWGFALPMAFVTGSLLGLGIGTVYLTISLEEVVKYFILKWRVNSNQWVKNLT